MLGDHRPSRNAHGVLGHWKLVEISLQGEDFRNSYSTLVDEENGALGLWRHKAPLTSQTCSDSTVLHGNGWRSRTWTGVNPGNRMFFMLTHWHSCSLSILMSRDAWMDNRGHCCFMQLSQDTNPGANIGCISKTQLGLEGQLPIVTGWESCLVWALKGRLLLAQNCFFQTVTYVYGIIFENQGSKPSLWKTPTVWGQSSLTDSLFWIEAESFQSN